jgi:hypothetical protein
MSKGTGKPRMLMAAAVAMAALGPLAAGMRGVSSLHRVCVDQALAYGRPRADFRLSHGPAAHGSAGQARRGQTA